jgi:hypothetical protein
LSANSGDAVDYLITSFFEKENVEGKRRKKNEIPS